MIDVDAREMDISHKVKHQNSFDSSHVHVSMTEEISKCPRDLAFPCIPDNSFWHANEKL